MTYVPTNVIEVSAWGQVVGAVARDPTTGFFAFEYDRDWISGGVELAPRWRGGVRQPAGVGRRQVAGEVRLLPGFVA